MLSILHFTLLILLSLSMHGIDSEPGHSHKYEKFEKKTKNNEQTNIAAEEMGKKPPSYHVYSLIWMNWMNARNKPENCIGSNHIDHLAHFGATQYEEKNLKKLLPTTRRECINFETLWGSRYENIYHKIELKRVVITSWFGFGCLFRFFFDV